MALLYIYAFKLTYYKIISFYEKIDITYVIAFIKFKLFEIKTDTFKYFNAAKVSILRKILNDKFDSFLQFVLVLGLFDKALN